MNLLISQYLRLLKERDELDALIPVLFQAMGLVPISHPQIGVRQNGVDVAAVGIDPSDDVEKLVLAVIKRGDIGRTDWNSGPQSVRQSLDEIFDVYLKNNVHPEHKILPVSIWVCTSGDLLQAVQENFVGYAKSKEPLASITFCGKDKLAELIGQYLLDENLFLGNDKKLLRKALVLIGDTDYDLTDYHDLILSQLKISQTGEVQLQTAQEFLSALTRIHLALNIVIAWGIDDGNFKQPLNAAERTLLWAWHALIKLELSENEKVIEKYINIYITYTKISLGYINKSTQHFITQDGMSRVSMESALISISIFRQISILSSVGISIINLFAGQSSQTINKDLETIVNLLKSIITNNDASSSPRLDNNSIDIDIALIILATTGNIDFAKKWISKLISKTYYVLTKKNYYPISSDSLEELAQIEHGTCHDTKLMLEATWMIPSLANWCVIFDMEDEYNCLRHNVIAPNEKLSPQLWHPTADTYSAFYFGHHALRKGETEVNIDYNLILPEMKERLANFAKQERLNIFNFSPALKHGFFSLDILACKHFRIPVPPVFIYSLFLHGEKTLEKIQEVQEQ